MFCKFIASVCWNKVQTKYPVRVDRKLFFNGNQFQSSINDSRVIPSSILCFVNSLLLFAGTKSRRNTRLGWIENCFSMGTNFNHLEMIRESFPHQFYVL